MDSRRYIVFDVETPNAANNRMSAIGLTVVEDGEILRELYTLVNPEASFDPFNIALTGISSASVRVKPTFPALWPLLEPILNQGILVAHNAPFDMGVLSKCLRDYGIRWKHHVPYLCTCQVGRKFFRELENRKLNTLCQHLGIPLDHHNAGSDSRACAQILLHYQAAGFDLTPYLRTFDTCTMRTLPYQPRKL